MVSKPLPAFVTVVATLLVFALFVSGRHSLTAQTAAAQNPPAMRGLSDSLAMIGDLLDRGRGIEAENLARALLHRVEELKGPDTLEAAQVLDLLYRAVRRSSKVSDADKQAIVERAVRIKEQTLGASDPELATSLINSGVQRSLGGDPRSAQPILERALTIREAAFGPNHPLVGAALMPLGGLMIILRDDDRAKLLLERAQGIRETVYGSHHVDTVRTLVNLAVLYQETGDFAGAQQRFGRALTLAEKMGGRPGDMSTLNVLNGAAIVLKELGGDFSGSARLNERLLSLSERTYGTADSRLRAPLENLAIDFRELGDYPAAKSVAERSLAIAERAFGPNHIEVARSLHTLATVNAEMGNYGEALALFERAIRIDEEMLRPSDPDIGRASRVIPDLFRLEGYGADDAFLFEAVFLERNGDLAGPNTNELLANLAALLSTPADYKRMRLLFERALASQERLRGPDHPEVAEAATNLAYVLSRTGDSEAATALYTRARNIWQKKLGPDHPKVATALLNLARIESESRHYDAAKPLVIRALKIQEERLGLQHPDVASTLTALADLDARVGSTREAFDAAARAEGIRREHIQLTSRTLSERQALAYASSGTGAINLMLSIGLAHPGDIARTQVAWNDVIRARGMVLDEMAARHRGANASDDFEIARMTAALAAARQRLATTIVRGPSRDSAEEYRRRLDLARTEKDRSERALAEKSARFRDDQARDRIGLSEVAAALPSGTALVGFVKFERALLEPSVAVPPAGSNRQPFYAAFVMHGGEPPIIIGLGSASRIDGMIAAWRRQLDQEAMAAGRGGERSEAAYRRVATSLRQQIWDPLVAHLSSVTRVFIVPDGALHLVSFAALPQGPSSYIVETGPVIHYLSAEKDLVATDTNPVAGGLLAMGSPAFDEANPVTGPSIGAFRGMRSACSDFQSMHFDPLPATLKEVNEVVSLWNGPRAAQTGTTTPKGSRTDAVELTGTAASEAAFKAQAAGRRILHLATHGFFLGDHCSAPLNSAGATTPAAASMKIAKENPLLLSGLILAGANHRNAATPDQEDGVLTAEEVAGLNLNNVEWAVLSGCDTGVGEVKTGEGVFGLRRAFQLAGVRTVIMSLWPVDDQFTRDWMRTLYDGRFRKTLSTVDAVREASLNLIRQRRAKHLTTHPFYWGGFVAAGDWR